MIINYFFVFSLVCGTFALRSVPVFLVDNENTLPRVAQASTNPFSKTSSIDFIELIHTAKKMSSCVIIFVESELCTEDISVKDKLGSPYYHLRQGFIDRKVLFYPAVTTPYPHLNEIFHPRHYNIFYLRSKTTKLRLYDNSYKYFYVFFEDGANETRADALRRHDSIMKEVYLVVKHLTAGPVLAFYTGKSNPVLIPKKNSRPFTVQKSHNKVTFVTSYGIIAFYDVNLYRFGKNWPLMDKIKKDTEAVDRFPGSGTGTSKLVTINFIINNFVLSFRFKSTHKYWFLLELQWKEEKEVVGNLPMEVFARWNSSYACSAPLVILNTRDTSVLTVSRYQLELINEWLPPADQAKLIPTKRNYFYHTVNCQPYFNSAIATSLFLIFLCLTLLMYGIIMMMDINTNSRYDDPQSPALVIAESM